MPCDNGKNAEDSFQTTEGRRAEILAASMDLFSENGFERTSIRSIAGAAGIAEGTIYRHFDSKRDILVTLLKEAALSSLTGIFENYEQNDDEVVIERFFRNRFAVSENRRNLMKIVITEAVYDDELADGLLSTMILPAMDEVAQYIEKRTQEGAFREVHPNVAAAALIGLVFSHAHLWGMALGRRVEDMDTDDLAAQLADIFLNGVAINHESIAAEDGAEKP